MREPLLLRDSSGGRRIAIVGATGSGKTTLAENLSARLGIPYVELDSIHWLPDWQMIEREAFRQKVAEIISSDSWILDGNYRKARDLIWSRATTIVWLDYSFPVVFWRLLKRSLRRMVTQEELWNGNRESFKGMFLSKDSLFLWLLQSYPALRKSYPEILARPDYAHLQAVRLSSPGETRRFLDCVAETRKVH